MNELQQVLNDIKQDKDTNLLPANLKDGVILLGVEGTLSSNIKLFETVESMNQSTGNNENDIALVYSYQIQNISFGDENITEITLPEQVQLPSEVLESNSYFYTITGGFLNRTEFRLNRTHATFTLATPTGGFRGQTIEYTSTDGINYTRITEIENPLTINSLSLTDMEDRWTDLFGYFMQIEKPIFNGLYKYTNSTWSLLETQLNLTGSNELLPGIVAYGKNGLVTGDGSVYDNLDIIKVLSSVTNLPESNSEQSRYVGNMNDYFGNIYDNNMQYLKQDDTGNIMLLKTIKKIIPTDTNYDTITFNSTYYSKLDTIYRLSDNSVLTTIDNCEYIQILNEDTYITFESWYDDAVYKLDINVYDFDGTKTNIKSYSFNISGTSRYKTSIVNFENGSIYGYFKASNEILILFVYDIATGKYTEFFAGESSLYGYICYTDDNKLIILYDDFMKLYDCATQIVEKTTSTPPSWSGVYRKAFKISDGVYVVTYDTVVLDLNNGTFTKVSDDNIYDNGEFAVDFYKGERDWLIYGQYESFNHITQINYSDGKLYFTTDKKLYGRYIGLSDATDITDTSISNNNISYVSAVGEYYKAEGKFYRLSTIDDFDIAVLNGAVSNNTNNTNNKPNILVFGKINEDYIGTISLTEYDTALQTSKQILGIEEVQ